MSAPAYQSLSEFYRDPASPYAGFAQEHRSGGSMPVKRFRAEQEAFAATDPAVPSLILLNGLRSTGVMRRDLGDGLTAYQEGKPGGLCIVRPHVDAYSESDGAQELMFVDIPAAPLEELLAEHSAGCLSRLNALTASLTFRDEPIRRVMQQLWTESVRAGGTSDLLIDGLTQVIIARLLDKAEALMRPVRVPTLSRDEIARLDRLIAAQMAERITVETLASALDMPR